MQSQYPDQDQQGQIKHKKTTGFAIYSFMYELYKAILVNGLKMPTPVQRKSIPDIMEGKDAIMCYKTGSGKTLAYILPMINKLKCHSKIVGARVLIIIPTKDLAQQITKVLKMFIKFTDLRYTLLLGGHTFQGQFESLSGNPDIIIATPGRLMQLLVETQQKLLSRVQMIVFDQADNLFESGFHNQLKQIMQRCPVSQRIMVSATINDKLNDFAASCLRQYTYIHQQISLPQTMSIDFFILRSQEKLPATLLFLQTVFTNGKTIIFVSTRYHVDYLLLVLNKYYQCYGIYGKMDNEQRAYSLDSFKKNKKGVLVVTDVAARGLDIPSVNYVLHYDYPSNQKTFIHRSGRTARKGQSGATFAFITNNEISYLTQLAHFTGKKLANSPDAKDAINYGQFPNGLIDMYTEVVKKLIKQNQQIKKFNEVANKAFQKFKKCRTQSSQASMKKAKNLEIDVHYRYKSTLEAQQQQFINKVHNYTPKKSFLQLQRINLEIQPENDQFLSAVMKIRKDQKNKKMIQEKKQKLREKNSKQWKQILSKDELHSLEKYKEDINSIKAPICIDGVQIQMVNGKQKKSKQRDFKNLSQYIFDTKLPGLKTQFDDLPKIKNSEIDDILRDQNPAKKRGGQRAWDKNKKDFVWKKDEEDKMSKEKTGKKAYDKWKKTSKMSIPKSGQLEDNKVTQQAKQRWLERRKFRHGWKQTKQKKGSLKKNNKTKAIQKKFKSKLIKKSMKGKGQSRR